MTLIVLYLELCANIVIYEIATGNWKFTYFPADHKTTFLEDIADFVSIAKFIIYIFITAPIVFIKERF